MTTTVDWAFISIGSNIEPERFVPRAVERLGALGSVLRVSRVYQSPAVGGSPQPDYLNAAALVETDRAPDAVAAGLRAIEKELGRVRTGDPYEPRTIDLDLSLYGNHVVCRDGLVLPHPDAATRAFVAVPISELAPSFVHPLTGESLAKIADRLRPAGRLIERPDVVLTPGGRTPSQPPPRYRAPVRRSETEAPTGSKRT